MQAKFKLNSINVFKALIDSHISHDEFVLVNYVLRKYDDVKEEIIMLLHSLKCQRKTPESRNLRVAKTNKGESMLLSK